ncbi:hypothetical protein PENTCL1PPCAC_10409, partial [Pristionchus entomophagus]
QVPSFNHIQERRTTVKTAAWLLSPLSILKVTVAVGLVVCAVFLMDGRQQWWPYTILFCFSLLLAIYSLLTLISHFFQISEIERTKVISLELAVNGISCMLCLCAFLFLCWDEMRMQDGYWLHHSMLPPPYISQLKWMKRVAVVMGAFLVNSTLFLFTFLRVRKDGFE